jgi:hypothetical protein
MFLGLLIGGAISLLLLLGEGPARGTLDVPFKERCATRLSLALTGQSPSVALLAAPNPQLEVRALLGTPEFHDRFARFINAAFNEEPGQKPQDGPAYYLARYVLANGKPWHELFDGPYDVYSAGSSDSPDVGVFDAPTGLGYFRSEPWLIRYRGNELSGLKIATAYRIMNNVIGLELAPTTASDGVDTSATGRMSAGCKGCHFEGPFALDTIAKVLTRWQRGAFRPSPDGPQVALDGQTITDDGDLVKKLLASTDHRFYTCRLAFRFLYGRPESTCESTLFDQCMSAYEASGMVQDTLALIAEDPGFCQ